MHDQALARAIGEQRRRCDSHGPKEGAAHRRRMFDHMLATCPTFRQWAVEAAEAESVGRRDAANLPFSLEQLEYVYTQAVEAEYPDLVFAQEQDPLIPFDTEIPEGAETWRYYMVDGAGSSEFFSAVSHGSLPSATLVGAEQRGSIKGHGSVLKYTVQELRAAAFAGMSLDAELAIRDRRGHAETLNRTIAWGRDDLNIPGFLNNEQITSSVAATKTAGGTAWENATPGELVADVLGLVNRIMEASRELYRPNVIALPARKLRILAQTRLSEDGSDASSDTVLEYLDKALNRVPGTEPQRMARQPIRFRACEDLLAERSFGWLDDDAMIAFNDDPRFVRAVAPMRYRVDAIQQHDFEFRTPTESTVGGCQFRFPVTASMLRGI